MHAVCYTFQCLIYRVSQYNITPYNTIIIIDDENTENRQPRNIIGETTPAAPVYPTRLDLQRFQKLLEAEDISTIASDPSLPPDIKQQEGASDKKPTQRQHMPKNSESTRTYTHTDNAKIGTFWLQNSL